MGTGNPEKKFGRYEILEVNRIPPIFKDDGYLAGDLDGDRRPEFLMIDPGDRLVCIRDLAAYLKKSMGTPRFFGTPSQDEAFLWAAHFNRLVKKTLLPASGAGPRG